VTKIGGITEMRKIIALAEPHSVELIPSVPHGPGLGVSSKNTGKARSSSSGST
jgi:L-alanine-DL-glutamate epimerase-like enolase superfamily enzyme